MVVKDLYNQYLFLQQQKLQPIIRKLHPSDVAFLCIEHPVITPFMIRASRALKLPVHFLAPDEDFSPYRKVIVPNGKWPEVKAATNKIPPEKRVYCEVGFFPQNKNVYFDSKGVHGDSSIREAELSPLSAAEGEFLSKFREYYTSKNFVKLRWDTIDESKVGESRSNYPESFIFVPLQLESDTAFQLCPFKSNQDMINAIQDTLPHRKLVFKVHPWDVSSNYQVSSSNILLPFDNRDLKVLIMACDALVNCNSTVMLEALLYGKKCASLGTGFSTDHNVSLECHEDFEKLLLIDEWKPDPEKVDSFLYLLLTRQHSVKFWKSDDEINKLRSAWNALGITK